MLYRIITNDKNGFWLLEPWKNGSKECPEAWLIKYRLRLRSILVEGKPQNSCAFKDQFLIFFRGIWIFIPKPVWPKLHRVGKLHSCWTSYIYIYIYIYESCPERIQPFWISREPVARPWCNFAANQRRPYCASVNIHSPVGLVIRQWDAVDWACVLCDRRHSQWPSEQISFITTLHLPVVQLSCRLLM